jgi:HAE1 family hydrophobic/amphiphilic exporter-1
MLPLLLGTGPGAEERRSIAVLVVGGQTLSLLLTLLAVPVVYSFFDDVGRWFRRRQRPLQAASPEPVEAIAAEVGWEENGLGIVASENR